MILQEVVANTWMLFQGSMHTCSKEKHRLADLLIQVYLQALHKVVNILLEYHSYILQLMFHAISLDQMMQHNLQAVK